MRRDNALVLVFLLLGISSGYNVIQFSSLQKNKELHVLEKDSLETIRYNIQRELELTAMELNSFRGISASMDKMIMDGKIRIEFYEHKIKALNEKELDQGKLIHKLRMELGYVKVLKKELIQKVENLLRENLLLKKDNGDIKKTLYSQKEYKTLLEEKINNATYLRAEKLEVSCYKKKYGDRFIPAKFARKVNCISLAMTIPENPLVDPGIKNIQIRIISPSGMLIAKPEKVFSCLLESIGEDVPLSYSSEYNYAGERGYVSLWIDLPPLKEEGVYKAEVYIDGKSGNMAEFILK